MAITYLEFYSGIGGWRVALEEACYNVHQKNDKMDLNNSTALQLTPRCLDAFDQSNLCNRIYSHNFSNLSFKNICTNVREIDPNHLSENNGYSKEVLNNRTKKCFNIEHLTKKNLEDYGAMMWIMSPPCQPHTRQRKHTGRININDISDKRSCSFLHLCKMLEILETESLPKIILLENVIGFEKSKSCHIFRKNLSSRNYSIGHFYFSPTQFGIPNDRPRYFSISVLPGENSKFFNLVSTTILSLLTCENETEINKAPVNIYTHIPELGIKHELDLRGEDILPLVRFLDETECSLDNNRYVHQGYKFVSSASLQKKASWCFDIVKPTDKRSSCFTSSYGKFIRGTGSILYIGSKNSTKFEKKIPLTSPQNRTYDEIWYQGLNTYRNLRYFSGNEIAKIMGFPIDLSLIQGLEDPLIPNRRRHTFTFPSYCTTSQQWKLMGNSLNVNVAKKIAEFGIYTLMHYEY